MSEHAPSAEDVERQAAPDAEEPESRGTLAVMIIYIAVLIAFWGWTFILLLQRG